MKTVLITGANKRIGEKTTCFFAARKWNVVIHFNSDKDGANNLIKKLKSDYPNQKFYGVQQDFSTGYHSADELFIKLKSLNIKIDVLINNASNFLEGSIAETEKEIFEKSFKVNFETPFFLMNKFAAIYDEGVIINVLDRRIKNNDTSYAAYSLSKKSLASLTKMAAKEFAPKIRVNGVAPGPVLPPNNKDNFYLYEMSQKTPLKEPVKLDNLLESIYFLVTNSSITGQIIFCDSGAHLL
ncbi:MAG: SDR family NAD(P)-dependent oxidoreductase [Bacteroidales bacterium]|nr:SDR family NAD(P)-dependent oxidoreductase [Bacteroidales bacterium]